MEGDGGKKNPVLVCLISTHALTWRATDRNEGRVMTDKISTHALTWRATFFFEFSCNNR